MRSISWNVSRVTTVACTVLDSASLAGSLLRAMERGSLRQVEAELDRSEGTSRQELWISEPGSERMELPGAVAHELHGTVARVRRRGSSRLEGVEVHLYLLNHLACARK